MIAVIGLSALATVLWLAFAPAMTVWMRRAYGAELGWYIYVVTAMAAPFVAMMWIMVAVMLQRPH